MTTARTHRRNSGRGSHRPRPVTPTPDDFVAVSAESFDPPVEPAADTEPFDPSTLDFEPGEHTVEEVKAYVTDNPETGEAIFDLESNGKGRVSLLSWLENGDDAGQEN